MKKQMMMLALACGLVGIASVPSALSYFTTNAHADGSYGIELGNDTDITETVEELTKTISVVNNEESQPVFVRVKLFFGSEMVEKVDISGTGWSEGEDGFWYYADPVDPGAGTGNLIATITPKSGEAKDFNVIVVSESTPVIYENNVPTADWSQVLANE